MPGKVKLLISWDILPSKESATLEFMANELSPAIQQLGITPTEAWYTIYGDSPQILVGAVADDLATMRDILAGSDWQELMERLDEYAHNRKQRLVRAGGRLQL